MTDDVRARLDAASIDRRKLLRIGAWAAPALLVATAVPAAAASTKVPEQAPPGLSIAIDQAHSQGTNGGVLQIYVALAIRNAQNQNDSSLKAATLTISPSGAVGAPFTGAVTLADALRADPKSKAAGAPLIFSGTILLGQQPVQGPITLPYVGNPAGGMVTITVSYLSLSTSTTVAV